MGFHVPEPSAFGVTARGDLLELPLIRLHDRAHWLSQLASAKPFPVRVSWMRADAHPALMCERNRPPHHLDRTRVLSACDVHRRRNFQQRSVALVATSVMLANVRVQIDDRNRDAPLVV